MAKFKPGLRLTVLDTRYVGLAGNQSIAGVKTFSSFPITPSSAPTTDYQMANKKYVDDEVAGVDLSGLVPYTGAIADVNLGAHSLTIDSSVNGKSLYLNNDDLVVQLIAWPGDGLSFYNPTTFAYSGIGWTGVDGQFFIFGSTAGAILDVSSITANKTFQFPNASGILALQSAITDEFVVGAETLTFTNGILTAVA